MSAPAVTTGYGGRLTVDLGALKRNWQALDKVSRGALTGAVVKADAYGTGIAQSARALYEAGARFFFAATPDEGIAVRAALPEDSHIFILNGLYPGSAPLYVGERLMPCLSSIPMLEEWLSACLARSQALPAALHFDTGINRLGFRLNEASIVKRMIDQVGYAPQMIMSHLACADIPGHEKNRTQLALFASVLSQFPNIPASLANSAGLMTNR
jgi:alanine racemase